MTLLISSYSSIGQSTFLTSIHFDFFSIYKNNLRAHVLVESDSSFIANCQISSYIRKENGDSLLICSKYLKDVRIGHGSTELVLDISEFGNENYVNKELQSIAKKFRIIPPGEYITYFTMVGNEGVKPFVFYHDMDSTLSESGYFYQSIFNEKSSAKGNAYSDQEILEDLLNNHNLTCRKVYQGDKLILELYANNWFLGRKFLAANSPISNQIQNIQDNVKDYIPSITLGGIENTTSIFSKIREINKKNKENAHMVGEVAMSNNFSNQTDPFSIQPRNFHDVNAYLETPIAGVPIRLEGYYTTQDRNRIIKSSFVRIHYDVSKAKEEMLKLIQGYKGAHEQSEVNASTLKSIYTNSVQNTLNQKASVTKDLKNKLGFYRVEFDDISLLDTSLLLQKMISRIEADSTLTSNKEKYQEARALAIERSIEIKLKYREVERLRQKAEKYHRLIEQYSNASHFDSVMAYKKIGGLDEYENLSYKDLSKTANHLLPNGKVKRFTTGITEFDAGIFSKYTSKYAQAGQQLKGVSFGYDLKYIETSLSTGSMEYIGRQGTVDKYTTYGMNLKFKPIRRQQFALDYFAYSPSKQMIISDKEFFKNLNGDYPSFQKSTSVVSANYKGEIGKYLSIAGDLAHSYQRDVNINWKPSQSTIAYNLNLEGEIPKTSIRINLGYENIGKEFKNNTLPFNLSGTERYKLRSTVLLFKNFLHFGLEYNYFVQHNVHTLSKQQRLGFDIKTMSKRYPNVAISYKPFSTFRSATDTLLVSARPLFGSVLTSRVSYQLKKHQDVWRLLLIYNTATSTMDSSNYQNDLFQANIIYSGKKKSVQVSMANMNLKSNRKELIPTWQRDKSYQLGINSYQSIVTKIGISEGIDMSFTRNSLFNVGLQAGLTYKMNKIPIHYRLSTRFNRYILSETEDWQSRISGVLDISYQFKYKLYERK